MLPSEGNQSVAANVRNMLPSAGNLSVAECVSVNCSLQGESFCVSCHHQDVCVLAMQKPFWQYISCLH
jgi:hypothetical protein